MHGWWCIVVGRIVIHTTVILHLLNMYQKTLLVKQNTDTTLTVS